MTVAFFVLAYVLVGCKVAEATGSPLPVATILFWPAHLVSGLFAYLFP